MNLLIQLFTLLVHSIIIVLANENRCCTQGQEQANNLGHCQLMNHTKFDDASSQLSCQLTAKLCCLKYQHAKLCRRAADNVFTVEPISHLLATFVTPNGSYYSNQSKVKLDLLSSILASDYSCDTKRNNDALCCLGCNLGLFRAAQWSNKRNLVLNNMNMNSVKQEWNQWCDINQTELKFSDTDIETIGFGHCCQNGLRTMHHSIRWCDTRPAPCSHRCHESASATRLVQCSCYEGYRLSLDGQTCVDIDECEELTHKCDLINERCHNTEGGFQCLAKQHHHATTAERLSLLDNGGCDKGYYYNDTLHRCKDIDECRLSLHNCDLSKQVCRNLLGQFVCLDFGKQCPSGFVESPTPSKHGAAINCVDFDECSEGMFECDTKREDCENFIGAYTCEPKFEMIKTNSSNATNGIAMTSSSSRNTENSTKTPEGPSDCPTGFHFIRFSFKCEDINECRIGQHNCDLSHEKCVNFPGSFKCFPLNKDSSATNRMNVNQMAPCAPGYERNEELDICEDINECAEHQLHVPCASSTSYCQNTVGSYVCHCKAGFAMSNGNTNQCIDVDECHTGLHNCLNTLTCVNTIGSYLCQVKHSSSSVISTAALLTERSHQKSSNNCSNVNQIYDQHQGRCVYAFGGGTVREVEESPMSSLFDSNATTLRCAPTERIVNGVCRQVNCAVGFFYNASQSRCQDVNECLRYSPCQKDEKCTNTVGSYRCTVRCSAGYRNSISGTACEDIDECALNNYYCPTGKECKNRPGSYVCQCPTGYFETNDGHCEDINECKGGGTHRMEDTACDELNGNQICINTPGSYRCECKQGYLAQLSASGVLRCIDTDECQDASLHKCEHQCINYAGSYKCVCNTGYRLASDAQSCIDIDECHSFLTNQSDSVAIALISGGQSPFCRYKCVNVPGSFQCICPPGYVSLSGGRICKDIDECEQEPICQADNEYCLNVRGSYRCNVINCPEGYFLEINSKKCLRHQDGYGEFVDLNKPLSYSYNYLSLISNISIPSPPGYLDLVSMSGPVFAVTGIKFDLALKSAIPGRYNVKPAIVENFLLRRPEYNRIIVSLLSPLEGPQDVELELTVSLYNENQLGGTSKAILNIVVSEYTF